MFSSYTLYYKYIGERKKKNTFKRSYVCANGKGVGEGDTIKANIYKFERNRRFKRDRPGQKENQEIETAMKNHDRSSKIIQN